MGGPSTAIAVEELRRIGVESLLRIGSCGALQSGIAVGELLLVQAAVRDEGTSRAYVRRDTRRCPTRRCWRCAPEAHGGGG